MTGLATYNDGTAALDTMVLRPRDYCARLAKYMTDASTIRKLCIDTYATAPERDEIQGMVNYNRSLREQTKAKAQAELRELEDQEKRIEEGRAAKREAEAELLKAATARERVRDYLIVQNTPMPGNGNPFEGPWRVGDRLVAHVADVFGLTVEGVKGRSRYRKYVHPRAIISRLLTEWGWSSTEVGRLLNRDHSSILHAVHNTFDVAMRDEIVRAVYEDLRGKMRDERQRRAALAEAANDAC